MSQESIQSVTDNSKEAEYRQFSNRNILMSKLQTELTGMIFGELNDATMTEYVSTFSAAFRIAMKEIFYQQENLEAILRGVKSQERDNIMTSLKDRILQVHENHLDKAA